MALFGPSIKKVVLLCAPACKVHDDVKKGKGGDDGGIIFYLFDLTKLNITLNISLKKCVCSK